MAASTKRSAKLTLPQLSKLVAKAGGFEQMSIAEIKDLAKQALWSLAEMMEAFGEAEAEPETPTSFAGHSDPEGIKPSKGFDPVKGSGSFKYEVWVVDPADHQNRVLVVAYIPPSFARRDVEISLEIDPKSPKVTATKVS